MLRILIDFLRSPPEENIRRQDWMQRMRSLLQLLLLYFALMFMLTAGLYLLGLLISAFTGHNVVLELWRGAGAEPQEVAGRSVGLMSGWQGWLIAAGYAPLMEELAFRLYLGRQPGQMVLSFSMLFGIWWGGGAFWLDLNQPVSNVAAFAGCMAAAYMLVSRLPVLQQLPQRQLVVFSILLFGLAHLLNYPALNGYIRPLVLLLALPQMLAGWMLAWVRMRLGFGEAVLLHGAINTCCMLMRSAV